MSSAAVDYAVAASVRPFGRAEVVGVEPGGSRVRVRPVGGRAVPPVWAELALPMNGGVHLGQQVLVAAAGDDEFFVCGVLGGAFRAPLRLATPSGASAEVGEDQETLRILSPAGELIFEYDPVAGKTRVCVPVGDLEIAAPEGSIGFFSGRDLCLRGDRSVEVSGGEQLALGVGPRAGGWESVVELSRKLLRLRSTLLRLEAERGEATVAEMNLRGESLTARWRTAKLVVERLETWAEDVITRAREVRQVVDRLWQLKVERFRTVARGACQLQGKHLNLRAEEDVKVEGERIDLG